MAYEVITDRTLTGFGDIFVYINDISGGFFMSFLLTIIFLIILISLLITQTKRTGIADFPLSFAVASLVTATLTVIANLQEGLISSETNIIIIAVTLMSVLFFLFSRK